MGLFGRNCDCLARDAKKIFDVYWQLAGNRSSSQVPSVWPMDLYADYNMSFPATLSVNGSKAKIFWAVSVVQVAIIIIVAILPN